MKVEIAENYGGAAIICYAGPDEIKVQHFEHKFDAAGKLIDELDLLKTLLDAASAAVASVPRPAPAPEGETKSDAKARQEKNAKALEKWQAEQDNALEEAEAAAQKAASSSPNAPAQPAPEAEDHKKASKWGRHN